MLNHGLRRKVTSGLTLSCSPLLWFLIGRHGQG